MTWTVTLTRNGAGADISCTGWANVRGVVGYALAKLVPPAHAEFVLAEVVQAEQPVHLAGADWTIDVRQPLQE